MVELSKIERVELREVWPDEAADFTPWLAEEENLSLLGEAIGLDLELREQESSVGSFSLDVLANDQSSGRPVIIENQLTETDHTHLGQILTYAAGHDAGTIVWISKKFRDEHRAALDYLNGRTGEDTEFFGVVVELWKIDDSLPAVKFDLVATPNEWRKQNTRQNTRRRRPSKRKQYRDFFQPLVDTMREEHNFTEKRKAEPRSWCPLQGNKVLYVASFQGGAKAWAEFFIGEGNDGLFEWMKERRASIETEFGEPLVWKKPHATPTCSVIAAERPGSIDDDDETLGEIRDWMVEHLLRLKRVLGPKLEEFVGHSEIV